MSSILVVILMVGGVIVIGWATLDIVRGESDQVFYICVALGVFMIFGNLSGGEGVWRGCRKVNYQHFKGVLCAIFDFYFWSYGYGVANFEKISPLKFIVGSAILALLFFVCIFFVGKINRPYYDFKEYEMIYSITLIFLGLAALGFCMWFFVKSIDGISAKK